MGPSNIVVNIGDLGEKNENRCPKAHTSPRSRQSVPRQRETWRWITSWAAEDLCEPVQLLPQSVTLQPLIVKPLHYRSVPAEPPVITAIDTVIIAQGFFGKAPVILQALAQMAKKATSLLVRALEMSERQSCDAMRNNCTIR